MNIFKRITTNNKIRKANKEFIAEYGLTRKVRVNYQGKTVGFITLERRKGFKSHKDL